MKRIYFLFLLVLLSTFTWSQNNRLFFYTEYSEKYDHTYVVLGQYSNSQDNENGVIDFEITGLRGDASKLQDNGHIENNTIARSNITLKVNELSKNNSINQSDSANGISDGIDRATYTFKTSFGSMDHPLPSTEESEMGNLQILWALISEVNINNGVMLVSMGEQTLMLKALNNNSSEQKTEQKSAGEKHLAEYGTMHFLFEEIDDAEKPNQYNKAVIRISEVSPNNFQLKITYAVWQGKNKNNLKEKIGDITLVFDILNVDMSNYDENNTAKLKVNLDKSKSGYVLEPSDSYEGYFYNLALAMINNKEWVIDVARGMYFDVNGNSIVFTRDYDTDNFIID